MAKELIWSEDSDYVYGHSSSFNSKEEFEEEVKKQYEDGECEVTNILVQPCITSEKPIYSDYLIPLASVYASIENYYTAEVSHVFED
ncbi:hypothetical protein IFU39_16365 [Paenibacillus sp. CFBP 13594]|uniref:hypothetical protein n=1 Tax=Paenibacillus sp. CFBP 13594 TaxID=2774037 RepID=UPI0017843900|nr:hypothetical protein [Paenibacillus sp. CFBP 13594]MBD8839387.1 hypothetical protein [Paenibacillus sp. CFBP 13594]